jgi:hypothetical protein
MNQIKVMVEVTTKTTEEQVFTLPHYCKHNLLDSYYAVLSEDSVVEVSIGTFARIALWTTPKVALDGKSHPISEAEFMAAYYEQMRITNDLIHAAVLPTTQEPA